MDRICNTYCVATATKDILTSLNVTFIRTFPLLLRDYIGRLEVTFGSGPLLDTFLMWRMYTKLSTRTSDAEKNIHASHIRNFASLVFQIMTLRTSLY